MFYGSMILPYICTEIKALYALKSNLRSEILEWIRFPCLRILLPRFLWLKFLLWSLETYLLNWCIVKSSGSPDGLALAVAEKSFSLEPFVLIVMHLMPACDIPSVRFFSSL
jgi:hypothetical protein